VPRCSSWSKVCVQLFERVGKRLVLNDAGRALLPRP
jgi:DNA-binding transcriptional LysR family regulator